jgi:hypothetical protein
MRMQTPEHNQGNCRQGNQPLARRLASRPLRSPEAGVRAKTRKQNHNIQPCSGLMRWQRVARLRRTLVGVKRPLNGPSSLERGSAATRTVVRSISLVPQPDELTHISRINRR